MASTIRSDAPLITAGCSLNAGVQLTKPPSLRQRASLLEVAAARSSGLGEQIERADACGLLALLQTHVFAQAAGDRHLAGDERQLPGDEQQLAADGAGDVVGRGRRRRGQLKAARRQALLDRAGHSALPISA